MRTVGQILKEEREIKLYTLDDVEKHTKIRKELLEALESDDYTKLPPHTFVQGFIKNYAKFLKIDADKLLAVFRRDYEASKHPPVILESFSNPLKNKNFSITPQKLIATTVVLIIIGFFAYLWVEYRQFAGAPMLEVASPEEQQTVDVPSVIVEGKTEPEIKVTINNQEIGVDQEGNFREEVKLSSSVNKVTIVATSKFGRSAQIERTVILKQ